MSDDPFQDDPNVGPAHLPGPDVGASVTIDDEGHVRAVDVDVPGTADGSDPLHWEPGGGSTPPADPGWMPNQADPNAPVDIMTLPPRPGWHFDPITHIEMPDLPAGGDAPAGDVPASDAPGDYPAPSSDEAPA